MTASSDFSATRAYQQAGVNIAAGEDLVALIKAENPHIGGFAGLFPLDDERYLVGCTDGVGTKLELSLALERYEELAQDLVAMSLNDLIVCGARPLFFLDYLATGKLDVTVAHRIVKGIQKACRECGCLLLGGETAEMPGFYEDKKIDLAGFAVGEVRKEHLIDGSTIKPGDVIVGLPSSGFHSNGYSLVRKIIRDAKLDLAQPLPGTETSLGEALTRPTTLYVKTVEEVKRHVTIKGMAHITGGGMANIARVLPTGCDYTVNRAAIPVPPVVAFIKEAGAVTADEAYLVWNMGLGFVMVVAPADARTLLAVVPGSFQVGAITAKT
jgi:phosphoribosylformylglycinamidine cyclo-ligase